MKIPCSIVRELLPNYIDDCMEDDAKILVEEHLKECDACRALYENMKKPLQDEHKDKELDYLKKVKKQNSLKIIIAILITICIFMTGILTKIWLIGSYTNEVEDTIIKVTNTEVEIGLTGTNRNFAIIGYTLDDRWKFYQEILYQEVMPSIFHSYGVSNIKIPLKDIEHYLKVGDQVITKDGKIYDAMSALLIEKRIPYVGDVSGVYELLKLADIKVETLSLKTDQEPYAINLIYQKPLSRLEKEKIENNAKGVLASIDNCNIINLYVGDELISHIVYKEKIKDIDQMQKLLLE
ncbi:MULTISPECIES: zf-HC2 domain-containing protein [Erysipelotrichaceae]|uniref:zf-HC2 domain-containing protein n=1 Tax=Erysipelotrichaceae TaxID=128827 RepID=UPI000E529F9B|nr:zf-HC2 domain-containing protein [Absiella sp. AM27-20]RHT99514.1 DUF4825 domain-containing protein [Absiella sp. AM27-20]